MSGPLTGVRVVDCTTVVLGPWAAQQLGDLGADVVKVEPPEGDTTRQLGPMRNPAMGAFYLAVNRNKRSIVLDLQAGGRPARAAPARRGRRRAAPQLSAAGRAAARHVVRNVPRRQPGHRLRRHVRLPGGRPLRRKARVRRHHPGGLRPRLGSGVARGRAALRAHDRRRQDQLDDRAGGGARGPLPQGAHGRGAGGRGADVREHGGLGDGGAPLRRDVRAAAGHDRLQADPQSATGARSRRATAISRSCRTPTRTGETSSSSPADRICWRTRATRRSPRASAHRAALRGARADRADAGRTPNGWPSWTGGTSRR